MPELQRGRRSGGLFQPLFRGAGTAVHDFKIGVQDGARTVDAQRPAVRIQALLFLIDRRQRRSKYGAKRPK